MQTYTNTHSHSETCTPRTTQVNKQTPTRMHTERKKSISAFSGQMWALYIMYKSVSQKEAFPLLPQSLKHSYSWRSSLYTTYKPAMEKQEMRKNMGGIIPSLLNYAANPGSFVENQVHLKDRSVRDSAPASRLRLNCRGKLECAVQRRLMGCNA